MFRSLFSWWRKGEPAPPLPHLHFVLYTRQGCHLCDEAWQELQTWQRRHGFTLQAVDVDSAAELAARHGDTVPVVAVNGKVRFRGRVNRVLLLRLLRAETRRLQKSTRFLP